jgi:ankyrin repeat protein
MEAPHVTAFMQACATGDVETLRQLLQGDPSLARERLAGGTTALDGAVRHPDAVQLLLEHGADPNARDVGDNATPLHFAAANGTLDTVRLLLDAGADVHGTGDVHNGDVIGWAAREGNEAVVNLLLKRGARHHVFSAMARSRNTSSVPQEVQRTGGVATSRSGSKKTSIRLSTEGVSSAFVTSTACH